MKEKKTKTSPPSASDRANQLHALACEKKEDHYVDPLTGYLVFTAYYHKKRGHCCQSQCRHCPWGYRKN